MSAFLLPARRPLVDLQYFSRREELLGGDWGQGRSNWFHFFVREVSLRAVSRGQPEGFIYRVKRKIQKKKIVPSKESKELRG